MKFASRFLLIGALAMAFAANAMADIQDPPGNDYGPTRKLGRSLANITYGFTEVPQSLCQLNGREGNNAAASYGVVRGFGRFFFRFGAGVYELVTAPFPTYKGSYRPFYKDNVPWIHGGYSEFPPELGFESHYDYSRAQTDY
jgi:putative exosortase-associated protein (TIGR04073 family)